MGVIWRVNGGILGRVFGGRIGEELIESFLFGKIKKMEENGRG
jgi:hypothetical protein